MVKEHIKVIATNKKAYHDYFIEDTYEAGIVLVGSEVKSVRQNKISFADSYIKIEKGSAFLENMYITPYDKGSYFNTDSRRTRGLLLNKTEIDKMRAMVEKKGYTLVPTRIYLKQALIKVEVGVAKGKHLYDKRQADKERQIDKDNRQIANSTL